MTYNVAATAGDYNASKEGTKEIEIAVPLKHLSNFWKTPDIPLINWSTNCVITSLEKRSVAAAQGGNPAVHNDAPTNAVLKITDCKLYVPVVTLSAEDDFRAIKNRIQKNIQME